MGTWGTGAVRPTSNYGGSAAAFGTIIYHFGGYNNAAEVLAYDTVSDTWTTKAATTSFLYDSSAVTSGNYIWVFLPNVGSRFVYRYDPATDGRTNVSTAPVGFYEAVAEADQQGKIWVTGYQASPVTGTANTYTGPMLKFDPVTLTWTTPASTGMYVQEYKRMALGPDGNLYVMGGLGGVDIVQKYDISTNAISTMAAMPGGRHAGSVRERGGLIYYIGGNLSATAQTNNWAYDYQTNTWSVKTAIPTSRYSAYDAKVGARIYVQGGSGGQAVNSYWDAPEIDLGTVSLTASAIVDASAALFGTVVGSAVTFMSAPDVTFDRSIDASSLVPVSETGNISFDALYPDTSLYPETTLYPGGDW